MLPDQVGEAPRPLIFLTVLDRDQLDAAIGGQDDIIAGPLDHHGGDVAIGQQVRDASQYNASILVLKSRPGLPRRVPQVAGQAPLKPWEASHPAKYSVKCFATRQYSAEPPMGKRARAKARSRDRDGQQP